MLITKGCLRLSLLECPANLSHLGRKLSVYGTLQKSNPNHWSSYRCLLPLQESPATFHVAEKLLRRRYVHYREESQDITVQWLNWAALLVTFCCIALPLLRSMIVHRSRHGDHCPCCTCLHIPSLHRAQQSRALGIEGILHLEGSR